MTSVGFDPGRLLESLRATGFEFVIIGGVAATAHGALGATRDLDVAAPLTPRNLARLLEALRPHTPRHALRPDLSPLGQSVEALSRYRLLMLDTQLGRLDVLSKVEPIGEFDQLESVPIQIGPATYRVLTLDQLIAVKRHLTRGKDRVALAELEAIRELRLSAREDRDDHS